MTLRPTTHLDSITLKPGQTPVTFFAGGVKTGTVYAYCNLHGLWKASLLRTGANPRGAVPRAGRPLRRGRPVFAGRRPGGAC